MGRRRQVHLHEVFYLKDRLLAGLASAERLGLAEQPVRLKKAMATLLPLIEQITHLETDGVQQLKAHPVSGADAQLSLALGGSATASDLLLQLLEGFREQLLSWSETYLSSLQWQRLQDAIRQHRRQGSFSGMAQVVQEQVARKHPQPSRWAHPNQGKDRFASRLLVPKRSQVNTSQPGAYTDSMPEHTRPH